MSAPRAPPPFSIIEVEVKGGHANEGIDGVAEGAVL